MSEQEIKKLEELVTSMPDNARLRLALGKAYLATGELDKAKEELRTSIENEPDNPEAFLKLGNAQSECKEFDLAIGNYQKALALDAYYVEALYCLGMAYVDVKEQDEVNKIIKRLEQLHPIWAQGLKSYFAKIL